MKITTGNTKLSTSIPNINLPAKITCRADAPCAKSGCYAGRGTFLYKQIKQCYAANLQHYVDDAKDYFDTIISQLDTPLIAYKFVRWHSSGDIVDSAYFKGMIRVAQEVPLVNFLCFTKRYEIVNQYIVDGNQMPSNLHIVFSAWDATWHFDNPFEFPVANVRFKNDKRDFSHSKPCSGACYDCLECWNLQKGESVVFNKH